MVLDVSPEGQNFSGQNFRDLNTFETLIWNHCFKFVLHFSAALAHLSKTSYNKLS